MKESKSNRTQRGFAVIESLVVSGIIGVLIAFVAHSAPHPGEVNADQQQGQAPSHRLKYNDIVLKR